jgi:hypothetical protein
MQFCRSSAAFWSNTTPSYSGLKSGPCKSQHANEMSEDFTQLHDNASQKMVLFISHVICRNLNVKKRKRNKKQGKITYTNKYFKAY